MFLIEIGVPTRYYIDPPYEQRLDLMSSAPMKANVARSDLMHDGCCMGVTVKCSHGDRPSVEAVFIQPGERVLDQSGKPAIDDQRVSTLVVIDQPVMALDCGTAWCRSKHESTLERDIRVDCS
jgi:hypothetical protein